MNFKKKELIVTIIMLIVFVMIGLGLTTYASSPSVNLVIGSNNSTNGLIITPNNTVNESNNIPSHDEPSNNYVYSNSYTNSSNNNNNNNATNTSMPYTGLSDMPWLIVAACVVSAVFAYKKIREYNI